MTDFTIANGQQNSNSIRLGGTLLAGLLMPSSWTAADLTLQVSFDDSNFFDVYDDSGVQVALVVAASRFVLFPSVSQFMAFGPEVYLRLRSSNAQGGERTIRAVVRQ